MCALRQVNPWHHGICKRLGFCRYCSGTVSIDKHIVFLVSALRRTDKVKVIKTLRLNCNLKGTAVRLLLKARHVSCFRRFWDFHLSVQLCGFSLICTHNRNRGFPLTLILSLAGLFWRCISAPWRLCRDCRRKQQCRYSFSFHHFPNPF